MSGEEDYEATLLVVSTVYVYRIPPRPSAQGYKAGDWPDSDLIWQGRLVVVERGEQAVIRLVDAQSGAAFAECPGAPGSVEPVLDSSRYFVLRVEDPATKRHAFLGMGFQERSEAFDFNATLQDHDRRVADARALARRAAQPTPAVDYSLHAGQTIHVELKASPTVAGAHSASSTSAPSSASAHHSTGVMFSANGGLLPPPPGSRSRARAAAPAAAAPHAAPASTAWGDFTAAAPASSSTTTTSFFN